MLNFSDFIKLSPLKGIKLTGREIIISQLADDITLFLKNAAQKATATDTIKLFSLASGLYLNINKYAVLPLKSYNSPIDS